MKDLKHATNKASAVRVQNWHLTASKGGKNDLEKYESDRIISLHFNRAVVETICRTCAISLQRKLHRSVCVMCENVC